MDYLKLTTIERPGKKLILLICAIASLFTSCSHQDQKAESRIATGSLIALPNTYITTSESSRRQDWFNNHKLPIISSLTSDEAGVPTNKKVDFKSLKVAVDFFEKLIINQAGKDTITGVRVYFASMPLGSAKSGRLTLIFGATAGKDTADVQNYYGFKNGELDSNKLDTATVRPWVHNYQLNIRPKLLTTMDVKDPCKETKHVWFSLAQIKSIIIEMKYQMGRHPEIVKGFGVRFTSYTDQDYSFLSLKPVPHHKRITIGFTFIDWEGEDIGIKQIDATEFLERLKITKMQKGLGGDTFDTGDPTPPPSTGNKAELDVSDE